MLSSIAVEDEVGEAQVQLQRPETPYMTTSVHELAREILESIFFVLLDPEQGLHPDDHPLLPVLSTCSVWHEIVISTPKLWSNIGIDTNIFERLKLPKRIVFKIVLPQLDLT